jgi:catechol 2,3-dioxygenase-like lactoylglutathione lyase family enzyme
MTTVPILRVARPTDDIEALLPFYCAGLGFQVLASFEDHQGFDGVMLGLPGAPYHLELTHHRGHQVGRAPTRDNLLVLYLPDRGTWMRAVARMQSAGFAPVPSDNPYWDVAGRTFEDPDGYRVVLQCATWPDAPG